jgi:unsaturated rhamnogalacturonyl hydrolase
MATISGTRSFALDPVVGLDCYHNDEKHPHYTWEDRSAGGFSGLGDIIKGLGATLTSIKGPLTKERLTSLSVFIIVDPDMPKESLEPKYFNNAEAEALEEWVTQGGRLVLLGNNKDNMEFKHFNEMTQRFGITFNEDTANTGKSSFRPEWKSEFMKDVKKIHIVRMCTLTLKPPASEMMLFNNQVLMATTKKGKGHVLAVGDPWFYNEYIKGEQNLTAAKHLFTWLLEIK